MAAPPTQLSFLDRALKSRLVTDDQVSRLFPDPADLDDPHAVAEGLVKAGLLTRYHAQMLQAGKYRGFFLGPYKILRPIGQGGMGTVFLAEHTSLSRKVAVKVLPPDKAKDRLSLERFNREARAAAALDHPNIVRLHDISQGNGVHFLVMEYVEGTDLQSLMGQTGPLHYAQAAQYVAQSAAGLSHAHEKGFIHRDIKPANLMLAKTGGGIKILDMGLARSFTDASDNLTANLAEGDIAGTVDYLSPEQAMNQPLDERSDIYSLGATFYALVAGFPPFKGTTAQKLMQHQLKEPPSVTLKLSGRVPQALSDVISKMMAKRPSERFQSAADVIDALGPWLPVPTSGNIVIDTPRPGSGQTAPLRRGSKSRQGATAAGADAEPRPLWKKPAVLVGAAIGLLMLVGGVIAAVVLSGGDKKPDGVRPTQPQWQPPATQPDATRPPAQVTTAGGQVVFRVSAADVPTFRNTKGQRMHDGPHEQLPAGVYFRPHKLETVGEFFCETVDGQKALGWANVSGQPTGQLGVELERPPGTGTAASTPLVPGRTYRTRLTYKTTGGAKATSYVQTQGDWKNIDNAAADLPDTKGEWRTVEYTWAKPDKPVRLLVDNKSVGADKVVYVREVSVTDADAAAAAPGKPLFTLDLSQQKAFVDRGSAKEGMGQGPWVSQEKTGDGTLPAGWFGHPWYKDDVIELFADAADGTPHLGFRGVIGKGSAMLYSPVVDTPGGKARLAVEYSTQKGSTGNVALFFNATAPQRAGFSLNEKALPPTDGEWKKVEVEVDLKGATAGRFAFHNRPTLKAPNAEFRLRAFTATAPPERAAVAPPEVKSALPQVPVKADFAAFGVGTYSLDYKTVVTPADGWAANLFDADATGELVTTTTDGVKVVTLANKSGQPSAQLFQTAPGGTLAAGSAYVLKVEYKATGGTSGLIAVREKDVGNWKDCPHSFHLDATGDKWETRTFEVEAVRDYPAVFVVQNLSDASGNALSVRKAELVPVGK